MFLGHSAGGHLATWAASRDRLRDGSVAAAPRVRPVGTVAQAGVLDLVAGADQGLGGGAVVDLLGGTPATVADRYALASPAALVPAAGPVVCVHGDADTIVPLDQSQRYVAAAEAARGERPPAGGARRRPLRRDRPRAAGVDRRARGGREPAVSGGPEPGARAVR